MGNCLGRILSHVMFICEKFSMFIAGCSLLTCVILCMTCMLAFGIGLGYNYSFVDYKTKHVYVAAQYKKTRPTNYHGPGYYKPTTKQTRKKPKLVLRASEGPKVFEVAKEFPVDLPHDNGIELMRAVSGEEPRVNLSYGESPLHSLYFTALKTLPTTKFRLIKNFNDSFNASTPGVSVKNETEVTVDDIADKSSIQLRHINTTEKYSGPEAIRVDVAKIPNVDNSSMSMTIMNLKQLLSFLTMLREKKKKFSIQVTL